MSATPSPPPSDLSASQAWLRIGDSLSHFRVKRKLGGGAMGVVVLAEDTQLHRDVALKILKRRDDNEKARIYFEQFLREARSAARLVHNNIVQIYEIDSDAGNHFIAMEFVQGGTLDDRVKKRGPLPIEEACRIGAQIAHALAYAHERGVTHRDIKPANVMLTGGTSGGVAQIKVCDFSLAILSDPEDDFEYPWKVVGSPYYMAPELAKGRASAQSDIFALCGVLWYLLTGAPPFDLKKPKDFKKVHTDIPLPDLRKLRPDVPLALVTLLSRGLARDPHARFASASEVASLLERIADGKMPTIAPIERPLPATGTARAAAAELAERMMRAQQRRRTLALGSAIGLTVVVVGLLAVVWLTYDPGPPRVGSSDPMIFDLPPEVKPPPPEVRHPDVKPPEVSHPDASREDASPMLPLAEAPPAQQAEAPEPAPAMPSPPAPAAQRGPVQRFNLEEIDALAQLSDAMRRESWLWLNHTNQKNWSLLNLMARSGEGQPCIVGGVIAAARDTPQGWSIRIDGPNKQTLTIQSNEILAALVARRFRQDTPMWADRTVAVRGWLGPSRDGTGLVLEPTGVHEMLLLPTADAVLTTAEHDALIAAAKLERNVIVAGRLTSASQEGEGKVVRAELVSVEYSAPLLVHLSAGVLTGDVAVDEQGRLKLDDLLGRAVQVRGNAGFYSDRLYLYVGPSQTRTWLSEMELAQAVSTAARRSPSLGKSAGVTTAPPSPPPGVPPVTSRVEPSVPGRAEPAANVVALAADDREGLRQMMSEGPGTVAAVTGRINTTSSLPTGVIILRFLTPTQFHARVAPASAAAFEQTYGSACANLRGQTVTVRGRVTGYGDARIPFIELTTLDQLTPAPGSTP